MHEVGSNDAATVGCPGTVTISALPDVYSVLRSKSVVNEPDLHANNLIMRTELGELTAEHFLRGILPFANGEEHRRRRKVLNVLFRPDELVRMREEIALPAADRWMQLKLAQRDSDGHSATDLAELLEIVFLELTGKLIGLVGLDTPEGIDGLRVLVMPLIGGMNSAFFEDRQAAVDSAMAAKRTFIDDYYTPSYAACEADIEAARARGDAELAGIPLTLMKLMVTEADPAYSDAHNCIREAMQFIIASVGTSVQAVLGTLDDLWEWFEQHPEDRSLGTDLTFISAALKETLRLKAPFIPYLTRLAVEDFQVGECPISRGDEIHALVPRAGRDAAVFGDKAWDFDPRRGAPEANAYGAAFGSGPHQCIGLRSVLGNDGTSGVHIKIIQRLFSFGVQPHPTLQPTSLPMVQVDESARGITNYITYPVIFSEWPPRVDEHRSDDGTA